MQLSSCKTKLQYKFLISPFSITDLFRKWPWFFQHLVNEKVTDMPLPSHINVSGNLVPVSQADE